MPEIRVTSPDDPRVAPYFNVKDADLARIALHEPHTTHLHDAPSRAGLFICEGEVVFRTLLANSITPHSVLTTPTRRATIVDALDTLPETVPVYIADQPVMDAIVGYPIHRGVLALAHRADVETPPKRLPGLLESADPMLYLEDLANHDNLGGIFRVVAALAGTHRFRNRAPLVLLSPGCADPLYRKALRVSVGHALGVPFARFGNTARTVSELAAGGVTRIALVTDPDAVPIQDASRHIPAGGRIALLLGAEGPGLTRAAAAAADLRVRIPMNPTVDSLNVVVAAGIALSRLAEHGDSVPHTPDQGNNTPRTNV